MPDRAGLADQLMLVTAGVYATIQTFGPAGPAAGARALVAGLLPMSSGDPT